MTIGEVEEILMRYGMTPYLVRRGRGEVLYYGTMYYKRRPGRWSICRTSFGKLALLFGDASGEWTRYYLGET